MLLLLVVLLALACERDDVRTPAPAQQPASAEMPQAMRDVRAPVTYCADTNPAHVAADYELLQADPEAVDLVNAQDILTPTDVAVSSRW